MHVKITKWQAREQFYHFQLVLKAFMYMWKTYDHPYASGPRRLRSAKVITNLKYTIMASKTKTKF